MGSTLKHIVDPLQLFLKDKPKTPKVPSLTGLGDAADQQAQIDAANEQRRLASASGRASTILTSPLGDSSTPNLATKTLLGD